MGVSPNMYSLSFTRFAIVASVALSLSTAMAGRPAAYYDGVDDSTSATARATAGSIVRAGIRTIGYANTWTRIFRTDEDPDNTNNVILVYGAQSRPKATGGTANSNNATGGWNREHAWPQGNYNQAEPMRSDLHALFPSDVDTNTARSDQDFGIASGSPANGFPDSLGNKDDNTFFEPVAESRGKMARGMLYMDVRYDGTGFEPDLLMQENGAGPDSLRMGRRSVLLQWHNQFKPTAFEIVRSAKIYEEQGNSNPFIDRPELASVIFPDGPAWTASNGTTITVASINRAPVATQSPAATNVPLLTVSLTMSEQQDFHVNGLTVTKLGTAPDAAVSQLRLVFDTDRSGTVTATDILVSTSSLSGGVASFSLSGRPFRLGQGRLDLLVAADIATVVSGGPYTLGARLDANSITHNASGGNDVNPTFANQDSGLTPVGSNVSNGDTLALSLTPLAPISALRGAPTVPMIRIIGTPSAGEFDLAQLAVTRSGSALDADVPSVTLHLDANNNGVVEGSDQALGTSAFSSGSSTIVLSTPFRFSSSTARSLILTVPVATLATPDTTVGLNLVASSVLHSASGGADVSGTNSAFASGPTTILGTQGTLAPTLVISEVYEGTSGNMKYVEIKNVTTGTISLNGKQLRRYANGGLTSTAINLSNVNLAAGGHYVVANNPTDFDTYFLSATADQFNANISHNGDDCYSLFDTNTSTLLDGFASDNIGTVGNFATNIVAFRVLDELPNDGAWGGVQQPATDQDSPSGYWETRLITASNGNSATIGSPGAPGLPVSLSGFAID
jgi:endonuclease I